MKEVIWGTPIEKAEFIFSREFMIMSHNYLCAVCKEASAVQDTHTGVLQPCWRCQDNFSTIKKKSFIGRLLSRYKRLGYF